jgi:hypothetical protein
VKGLAAGRTEDINWSLPNKDWRARREAFLRGRKEVSKVLVSASLSEGREMVCLTLSNNRPKKVICWEGPSTFLGLRTRPNDSITRAATDVEAKAASLEAAMIRKSSR